MTGWQPAVLHGFPAASTRFLIHFRQSFLRSPAGLLFDAKNLVRLGGDPGAALGLGFLDGSPIFLWQPAAASALAIGGADWCNLRQLLSAGQSSVTATMLRYAAQIGAWHSQHRFCGSCGEPLASHPTERAMVCQACDLHHYPRLSPCMIVLITDGDRLLLARSPRHSAGMYSTLAGFVEPGETVEQCVEREVQEEVGVLIDDIRYVASQNWPFPHSLMLGFRARYRSGDIVPQPGEIEDARWFAIDQLPELPSRASIARYLIDSFVAERRGLPAPQLPL